MPVIRARGGIRADTNVAGKAPPVHARSERARA